MTVRMNELAADIKTEINVEREERINAMRDLNNNPKSMDDRIKKELERRDQDIDTMNSTIEELTRKVAGMESGTVTPHKAKGQENWRPTHIVFGGWAPQAAKDVIEKDAQKWLDSMDAETRGPTKRAYCPRLYGAIAKVKIPEELLVRTAFRWQCAVDANRSDAPPRWAVVERSPALGTRRRIIRSAADWMKTAYPQLQLDTASGDVMKGPETIARLGRDARMWTKGFVWDQSAGVERADFSEKLKAAALER